jgi:uncharacterized protein (TIGR00369 family)
MPPSPEALARYAAEFSNSRALKHFGLTVHFPDPEHVEVRADAIRPEHRGGLGTDAVNGGVLAAVFDLAIGCSAALVDPTRRSATTQLSMSFERPLKGDAFRAVSEVDSFGSSLLFASARIIDQSGQVCARCRGVVRLSKLPWKTGGSPSID